MSITTNHRTVDEYFEVEFASEERHEYVDGEILEMVGGSGPHNDICGNLYFLLKLMSRSQDVRICCGNSRMRVPTPVAYLFPEAAVVKGECDYEAQRLDTVRNPAVLFEVLSPSTEQFDRGRKFDLYQQIASLEEYVLISQEEVLVERFTRQANDNWKQEVSQGLDSVVRLESLDWTLALSDLYEKVAPLPKP